MMETECTAVAYRELSGLIIEADMAQMSWI